MINAHDKTRWYAKLNNKNRNEITSFFYDIDMWLNQEN